MTVAGILLEHGTRDFWSKLKKINIINIAFKGLSLGILGLCLRYLIQYIVLDSSFFYILDFILGFILSIFSINISS